MRKVRLANLRLLVQTRARTMNEVAEKAGVNAGYLSQIINERPTPKGTKRGVGNVLATRLEQAYELPDGWMDEPHDGAPAPSPAVLDDQLLRLIIRTTEDHLSSTHRDMKPDKKADLIALVYEMLFGRSPLPDEQELTRYIKRLAG